MISNLLAERARSWSLRLALSAAVCAGAVVMMSGTAFASGTVSGVVTAASTGEPLGSICVYLYQASSPPPQLTFGGAASAITEETASEAPSYSACTLGDGTYSITDVNPGSYYVEFVDPTGTYDDEWYDGTTTGSGFEDVATPINVSGDLSGIDAAMSLSQPLVSLPEASLPALLPCLAAIAAGGLLLRRHRRQALV
jgi:hypothetical protein